jgi:hypothetical protein
VTDDLQADKVSRRSGLDLDKLNAAIALGDHIQLTASAQPIASADGPALVLQDLSHLLLGRCAERNCFPTPCDGIRHA